MRLWSAATGEPAQTITCDGPVFDAAFVGDGRIVAAVTGAALELHDAGSGARLWSAPGRYFWMAVSGDGRRLVTSGYDEIVVWDVATRTRRFTLEGHVGAVPAVTFTSDGALVVTGGGDGAVRIWDAATGRPLAVFDAHRGAIGALAVRPDGGEVAAVLGDLTVRRWDTHLEDRPAADLEAQLARHVPWTLDATGRLLATPRPSSP
ncbi:MAG: PQQ-binding-like beta-propeller repeat protein [Kofleriaceae bacterium]|nr:PQQ-binding-like beta-propeller repeat protein [Kofleriaceae bacterium]